MTIKKKGLLKMKYDHLRQIQPKDRPKSLSIWGKEYFSRWKYLKWFILASIPGITNALVMGFSLNRWQWALFGFAICQYLTIVGFISLCSGTCTSNWGTYFKDKEPWPFWIHMLIISGAYVFVICLMWLGKK